MAQNGHEVTLDGITHRFGDLVAVRDIRLDIAPGELVALLGPSGCGKTTLLRIVAGFVPQSAGRVLFDREPVDHLPPHRRGVGIVFQNYALFPHMTVAENVAYGLEARHAPKARVRERVADMLRLVHMEAFAERLPRQLSGGQQQRVALARALAVDPKILLLDEPFGALDKNLRLDMQIEVKRLQRDYGITTILVTHDQEEALSMADRIAVMNRGHIEQLSPAAEIYDRPRTLFVNRFVGHTNLFPGRLERDGAETVVVIEDGIAMSCDPAEAPAPGTPVYLSLRPEHLRISPAPVPQAIPATVTLAMPLGPHTVYEAGTIGGASVKIQVPRDVETAFAPGQQVYLVPPPPDRRHVFPRNDH